MDAGEWDHCEACDHDAPLFVQLDDNSLHLSLLSLPNKT